MARWLVTQGDRQFSAQDLNELKQLASQGKIGPGDMVQPPGASDWLYASELPELKGVLIEEANSLVDDLDFPVRRNSGPLIAVLVVLVAVAGFTMYYFGSRVPRPDELALLGEHGLKLTEMLVTADTVNLRARPEGGAASVGTVTKDQSVQLVAKRAKWYQVKSNSGAEGWVEVDQVVPAYYFADSETRSSYDPIYNPDRYVFVKNSSWMQLPDQRKENVTIFQFLLQNKSKFGMADIKLLATIKDKNDKVLETKEIDIEGTIPPFDGVMVGTLGPEEENPEGTNRLMTTQLFNKLAKRDPNLNMRWSAGVEVHMQSEGFVEANIDLLQVRAIPKKL